MKKSGPRLVHWHLRLCRAARVSGWHDLWMLPIVDIWPLCDAVTCGVGRWHVVLCGVDTRHATGATCNQTESTYCTHDCTSSHGTSFLAFFHCGAGHNIAVGGCWVSGGTRGCECGVHGGVWGCAGLSRSRDAAEAWSRSRVRITLSGAGIDHRTPRPVPCIGVHAQGGMQVIRAAPMCS